MPTVRKMTEQEVQKLNNKNESKAQRKLVEEEYDAILSDYDEGDYGEVTLDSSDIRLTVRNRLKAAARRRGVDIYFRRTNGMTLLFKIVAKR